jgi:hypothetical protein
VKRPLLKALSVQRVEEEAGTVKAIIELYDNSTTPWCSQSQTHWYEKEFAGQAGLTWLEVDRDSGGLF